MPNRKYQSSSPYRYGFNGKENDIEAVTTGEGTQDYGMRIYNPSLGKFLSVDPLCDDFPWLGTYAYAEDSPIQTIDLDGAETPVIVNPTDIRKHFGEKAQAFVDGTDEVGHELVYFFTDAMFKSETWKQAVLYIEEVALNSSPYSKIYNPNTPKLDAQVKDMEDNLINGNEYSRTKYLTKVGWNILLTVASDKGLSKMEKLGAMGKKIPLMDDIFSSSIVTRGVAETYAVMTKYKGYINMNTLKNCNPVFDLYDVASKTIVDVTTTSAKSMSPSQFYKKLVNLSKSAVKADNRVLQIYIKEGQYTAEQIKKLKGSLDDYIKDFDLKSTYNIEEIKK